ncbi:hypothetical protein ACFL2L_00590 [Patescibacteria group bacterium]
MNNKVDTILEELYELDGSFREHEKNLKVIIEKILISRPEIKIDNNFKKQLRAELLLKAEEWTVKEHFSIFNHINNLFTMKKLNYIAGGVALGLLISISAFQYLKNIPGETVLVKVDSGLKIAMVGENSFGDLSGGEQQAAAAVEMEKGIGAGGGGGQLSAPSGEIVQQRIGMPNPYSINYAYIYNGEPINLEQEEMEVLKRIKSIEQAGEMANMLKGVDFGLVDMNTFPNSKIQEISFAQDSEFGYVLRVSLTEGNVSIHQNWNTWPQPRCSTQKCFEEQRLKIEDVPADENIIKIADDFIKKHGINMELYGDPEINDNWRVSYEQSENKDNFNAPEVLTITYPLNVNGKNVYEDGGGNKIGLSVAVNIKQNRAISLYNLYTQSYTGSLYKVETDLQKIMAVAKKGGLYNYEYPEPNKTIEVEIGQPKISYVRKWIKGEEILAPALVFPIIGESEDIPFYKKNVVVPLVKELLKQRDDVPVQIMREAVAPIGLNE